MSRLTRRIGLLVAFTLFALVLAACGGGGTGGGAPTYDYGNGASSGSAAPPTAASGASGATGAGSGYDHGAPDATPSGGGQSATAQPSDGSAGDVDAATPTNPQAQRYTIVAERSKATYHARQQSFVPGIGAAVDGSTNDVSGAIFFDRRRPSRSEVGTITVRLDTLTSGIALRDQRLRGEYLESSKFPIATFKATRLGNLPDTAYTVGQELRFKIAGDLTVHGVTREVTFDATARITGDTLTSTATTTVMMSDFGIKVPDLLNFVKAQNTVGLELSITAQRA